MKRYQECNKLGKFWRRRHYLYIPFKWLFYIVIAEFRVYKDEIIDDKLVHTDEYYVLEGRMLWRILLGSAQVDMNWTYTMDEAIENIENLKDELKNGTEER